MQDAGLQKNRDLRPTQVYRFYEAPVSVCQLAVIGVSLTVPQIDFSGSFRARTSCRWVFSRNP